MRGQELLDILCLPKEDVKRLCVMPPNRLGLGIAIFTGLVYLNFLSIIETITMPLVVVDKRNNFDDSVDFLAFNFDYAYLLFLSVGLTAALSFFFYKNAIIKQVNGTEYSAISDRSYVIISLLCCIIGTGLLIDFEHHNKLHPVRTVIGLCIGSGGTLVGIRATVNMFAKINGVNPFSNIKYEGSDRGPGNSRGMSYINSATLFLSLWRLGAPFLNAVLLAKHGPFAVFALSLSLFATSLLAMFCCGAHMKAHHSYLICKQLEGYRDRGQGGPGK